MRSPSFVNGWLQYPNLRFGILDIDLLVAQDLGLRQWTHLVRGIVCDNYRHDRQTDLFDRPFLPYAGQFRRQRRRRTGRRTPRGLVPQEGDLRKGEGGQGTTADR